MRNDLRTHLNTITDLCIAINAVEGGECAPEYQKQNKRVCKSLNGLLEVTAKHAIHNGATDKQLRKALTAAGWEDQTFRLYGTTTKIVRD